MHSSGTPLHLRGATVVECRARYLGTAELSVLQPAERGHDTFTLSGWLSQACQAER